MNKFVGRVMHWPWPFQRSFWFWELIVIHRNSMRHKVKTLVVHWTTCQKYQVIRQFFNLSLSWIHTKTLAFFYRFAMSCSVFIQTPMPLLAIQCSCRAFSDDQLNPVSQACIAFEVDLFSTHVAISLFRKRFDIDLSVRRSWPQKMEMRMRQSDKKMLAFEYEFSFMTW